MNAAFDLRTSKTLLEKLRVRFLLRTAEPVGCIFPQARKPSLKWMAPCQRLLH